MNEDKHSEDIDFTHYDHIKEFTIGEIAKLWCGIDIYAPIPPDKLPKAKAIGIKIINALKSKDLKCKFPSDEYHIDDQRRRINYEVISKEMLSHATWASVVIDRKDLVNWANDNAHKPRFLFAEEEETISGTSTNSQFTPDTKCEDVVEQDATKPTAKSMKEDMQRDKEALANKWRKKCKTFIQMDLSKELAKYEKYNHIKYTTIEKLTRKA